MYLAVLTWLPSLPSLLHPKIAEGVLEALGLWQPNIVKGMLPVILALLLVTPLLPCMYVSCMLVPVFCYDSMAAG